MIRPLTALLLALVTLAGTTASAGEPALETEDQKTLYMLGMMMAQRVGLAFNAEEVALVAAGLGDGLLGRAPRVSTEYAAKIQPLIAARINEAREAGAAYCENAAREAGAVRFPSGVVYTELEPGSGEMPAADATVTLHYHGTLYDGKIFDSSRIAGQPATFKLDEVISCFGEVVQQMRVGGKSRVICPPETAYGEAGAPPKILPGATLTFEVELLSIVPPASGVVEPAPAPAEPASGSVEPAPKSGEAT